MSVNTSHSVAFNNDNIDFDVICVQLNIQLSEEILIYNKVDQVGFELNTDFDSSSLIERSLDAFNQLFYMNVKITFRDLSLIRNIIQVGYFTQYDKWNYIGNTQRTLLISESVVDSSFQVEPYLTNQELKYDFKRYMVNTYLGNAKLAPILKQKINIVNNVVSLDDTINSQILDTLSPLTTDGILYERDYQLEASNNYYPLNNEDGTKISRHNPFRVLLSNILNENIIDSSNHVMRREHLNKYVNPIMDYYYSENVDNIFYLQYQTNEYDASNEYIHKYAGPLFFDISNAITNNDLFSNPTLSSENVLTKTYENDYDDYVFYALPEDVSGGYREYDLSDNQFADTKGDIYTLIDTYTTKTIVDLESFNSKLIPFHFINGDSLNLIATYKPIESDICGTNAQEVSIPSRSYKIKIKLTNYYYDYDKTTNSYFIFYNKDKYDEGILSSANVLHSTFQNSGDPVLTTNGWNYTLDYDNNNDPKRQIEEISSLYNSTLPHIVQAFHIQLLDENTSNNYNFGVSDLKMGHLLTDHFVDVSGAGFQWQTQDTSNSILIVNDPNSNVYYISNSSSNDFIEDVDGIGINTQNDPIFVFQFLINKPINNDTFFNIEIDSFTNNKKKNASGTLMYDHRMTLRPKLQEFTQSFYVPALNQTFEVSQINSSSNLFLVYPPNKISSFQEDVSNNPSTYDISGYNNLFGGLYIDSVSKNDEASELLNNNDITWYTNSPVSRIQFYLRSHTGESATFDPTDFTLRNIKINVNSTILDYRYYSS